MPNSVAPKRAPGAESQAGASPTFVDQVRVVIRDRIGDSSLSTENLVDAFAMSRATFYRRLREAGATPFGLIREERMAHARGLLAAGHTSVATSEAVGYLDLSAFSRAFRHHHGVSPSAWAARHAD